MIDTGLLDSAQKHNR